MQAKIIVKDECNVKIEGLDLSTRKSLVNKFKYQLPYARHLPSVKLGRWDGCMNFFTLAGSSYINLLPKILPELENRGYDIDLEDLREYRVDFSFDAVSEDSFAHCVWPKGHPDEGKPILLRDYQVEAINLFFSNPQSLQEISTGAGKTIITAALSQRCEAYGRTIVIVPNKNLVWQTEADYRNLQLDVGVYFGDRKEYNKTHTICTWQSLNNLLKITQEGIADFTISDFLEGTVAVIVDECHQIKADVLKSLLTGIMSNIPIRWGMTGTIPKEDFDFISLLVSVGDVVNRLKASELQEKGVLSNCEINIVQLQEYVEYRDYQSELKYLTTNEDRLKFIANMIKRISNSGNTLVLVDRIAAGELLNQFIDGSVFVSGEISALDRKEQYDDIATNDNKILIATYGVASTGINIIRLHNVVLIEPGKSFVRTIQSIGRGLRKGFDKDFVSIWDVTSSCKFSKRHLTKRKAFYKEANYKFTVEKISWID